MATQCYLLFCVNCRETGERVIYKSKRDFVNYILFRIQSELLSELRLFPKEVCKNGCDEAFHSFHSFASTPSI